MGTVAMAKKHPLEAGYEDSASIARRIAHVIRAEEASVAFAWPGLSEYARRHAMGWAAVREGYRMLNELQDRGGVFDDGGGSSPGDPQSCSHGQPVDSGEVLDGEAADDVLLAEGTLPP